MSIYIIYFTILPLFLSCLFLCNYISFDLFLSRISYSYIFYVFFLANLKISLFRRFFLERVWFYFRSYTLISWAPFYSRNLIRN